jgi:hypothetical protein
LHLKLEAAAPCSASKFESSGMLMLIDDALERFDTKMGPESPKNDTPCTPETNVLLLFAQRTELL